MRILVTGGAGFIGSHVADAFSSRGHAVAVLDNLSTGFRRNIPKEARFFEQNILYKEGVTHCFKEFRPEIICHHAAQMDVRFSIEEPEFDAQTNILGTLHLILAAVEFHVHKFIYVSSGGAVYGEPDALPVSENHPVKPDCAYGITKHTPEHYLYLYKQLEALDYTVLRYANVYGPRQNPKGEAGVNAIFIDHMLEGKPPVIYGDGEQLRDYVYVSDIVEANILALEKGSGQILNIGSGMGTSVNQIASILAKLLDFHEAPIYAPARAGEIQNIYLDPTLAKKILGWNTKISFEEGLRRTIEWHKSLLTEKSH
ncbi:NAD-dependent epimerase/dehydratase family protein [bacterium]|nr:NAD-dependent epimerase/dehydratase family protein [bacterium]